MIRLFVIEDHVTVIISSMRYLFRPSRDHIVVSGFATSVEEAINNADTGKFDLFVLDLYIPGYDPLENIRRLIENFPDKPIAIYSGEKSVSWKNKMIKAGAKTYITKDATREEHKFALQKAANGELYYSAMLGISIDQITGRSTSTSTSLNITPFQQEIVGLLSEGFTHKEISEKIGISRSLIEKILKNLRKSLNVKNNNELIKILTRSGEI